jgi:hypothetical protein
MAARYRMSLGLWIVMLVLGAAGRALADSSPSLNPLRLEQALQTLTKASRPGQDGLVTVWDDNKYVQCRRLIDRTLRCEAAGATMQPSLKHVLTPDRIQALGGLGWVLDPAFGNYARTFAPDVSAADIADAVLLAMDRGYAVDPTELEFATSWVKTEPCPPRNGYSQNLAGSINDAPAMAATAVHGCKFTPPPEVDFPLPQQNEATSPQDDLTARYAGVMTLEIQRLRAGYVQCRPQPSPLAIYCEAQSAESWAALAGVLTSERIARLHAAGFADPGPTQNYSKTYLAKTFDDDAIAAELLAILQDVYGYSGSPKLTITTESGTREAP